MSTALAGNSKPTIKSMLLGQQMKDQLALALPKHLSPERFIRVAITAMTRTPKLADCDQASFFKCLLDLSAAGLEPDGRRAHLIPYGTTCQLIIDYKGLLELAKRSGEVKAWRAELVCERDAFQWADGVVSHSINWREDRGATQCVYSHVTLSDGTMDYEVMTLAEVEAIRKRSRAASAGPWVSDFGEMAKKTVIRRHSKRLTLSPEFHQATEADFDSLAQVNGRVVPKIEPFLPPPTAALQDSRPLPAARENTDDAIPFDAPEPPPAAPTPAAKATPAKRATKPTETLELDSAMEEPASERLERRIAQFGLDGFKVDEWREKYPEHDAQYILNNFTAFAKECQP